MVKKDFWQIFDKKQNARKGQPLKNQFYKRGIFSYKGRRVLHSTILERSRHVDTK